MKNRVEVKDESIRARNLAMQPSSHTLEVEVAEGFHQAMMEEHHDVLARQLLGPSYYKLTDLFEVATLRKESVIE